MGIFTHNFGCCGEDILTVFFKAEKKRTGVFEEYSSYLTSA